MNKIAITLVILAVAALAMGLPYLLRRGSVPAPAQAPIGEATQPTQERVPSPAPSLLPVAGQPFQSTSPAPAPGAVKPAPGSISTPAPAPAPAPVPVPASPQPPAPAAPVSVAISNFAFVPANLTIKKGTTVTWTNTDDAQHTVTGDTSGPASSLLAKGSTYSFTFAAAGTVSYHCSPHPFMHGTITVTE